MNQDALNLAKELAQNFAKRASEADKKGELPLEDVKDLKTSGFLGLPVPKAFGGWGASLQECVAAQLEFLADPTKAPDSSCTKDLKLSFQLPE